MLPSVLQRPAFTIASVASWSAALTVAYWTVWILYTRFFHPLRNVPGPWLASVTRLWYVNQIAGGDMEKTQRRWHAKYGPLIRIAPNEIVCAAPEAKPLIYRNQAGFNKTDFYPVWNAEKFSKHRDTFTDVSDKTHAERRRIVNPVYTLANILKSEPYLDKCTELLIKRLEEHSGESKPFNLGRWIHMYAYDVIGELYFGNMFGFLQTGEDHGQWMHSLDLLMPFLCMCAVAPTYIRPLILASSLFVPGSLKAVKSIEKIATASREVVQGRLGPDAKKNEVGRTDLLEQLNSIHLEKGDKVDFGLGDITQEAYVALFAGSDTTAVAFRAVFYYLMKNPSAYTKAVAEIDQADKEGKLSTLIKYSEISAMPYLCASIKEAMRLHPSVQLSMSRVVPTGGLTLCDTYIPAGYWVGQNPAVVQLDHGVFGEDADEFKPERWLDAEAATKMDKSMLVFGAGTRTCIGKNIAIAEIYKVVPEVLRRFEMRLSEPDKEWKTRNTWFSTQSGVLVDLKKR